jgi:hypothetical protein
MQHSNYICVLGIENELALKDLMQQAIDKGISVAIFREPDLNDEITAIALAPCSKSKKLCRGLKLALAQ